MIPKTRDTEASLLRRMGRVVRTLYRSAIVLPLVVTCIADLSARQEDPSRARAVDALFAEWDDLDSPGAAIAVIRAGQIVFERGYGSAQLEYHIPVTPSTVFHVASVSKQFTAMAINLLVDRGMVALDDDIRIHLPYVPDFGSTITIHHLLHHTSGLRDQWELLRMAGWRMDDVITTDHILNMVRHQRDLNFAPGSEYLYCNTGYTLLAQIVERVSGEPFTEFTRRNIFEPLGMGDTHFHDDHRMVVANRAYSYAPNDSGDGFEKRILSYANTGATSLFTTVQDLARWAVNFERPRVGSRQTLERIHRRGVLNNGEVISYAHALVIGEYRGLPIVQHGGADAGFRSQLIRFPEQDLAIVVLSNLGTMNPGRLARAIADIYLADRLEPLAEQGDTRSPTRTRSNGAVRDDPLSDYVGDYYSQELGTFYSIVIESDNLVARHQRHGDLPLSRTPVGDELSGSAGFFRILRFVRDARGEVTGFRVTGSRVRNLAFERIMLTR